MNRSRPYRNTLWLIIIVHDIVFFRSMHSCFGSKSTSSFVFVLQVLSISFFVCHYSIAMTLIFPGKIQALLATTKEQRREYKSKFVDMDVEFARMRERLETMNLILDDIQVRFFKSKLECNREKKTAELQSIPGILSLFVLRTTHNIRIDKTCSNTTIVLACFMAILHC